MRKNRAANHATGGVSIALAVGAHPDDIEFMMAGTLLLLKEAGARIHMWNVANGCCGSDSHGRDELIAIRRREAAPRAAALSVTSWGRPVGWTRST